MKRRAPAGWPAITPGGAGFIETGRPLWPAPGGSDACPSFIPHELVAFCQQHKSQIGMLRTTATLVSPFLNLPTAGVGGPAFTAAAVGLNFLANGCDGRKFMKSEWKQAKLGAEIGAVVMGIGAAVAPYTGPGAIATPFLVAAGAVAVAEIPIFDALSKERAPRASDWIALGVALAALGGVAMPKSAMQEVFRSEGVQKAFKEKKHTLSDKVAKLAAAEAEQHDEKKAALKQAKNDALHEKIDAAVDAAKAKAKAKNDQVSARVRAGAGGGSSASSGSSGGLLGKLALAGLALKVLL